MKLKSRSLILAGICAGLPLCAALNVHGQESRFYIRGDLGGNLTQDTDLKEFFGPVTPGSKVKFDPVIRLGVAGGYDVTDWFAAEVETGYMGNTIDSITDATRDRALFSNVPFLANAKFQLPLACGLTPYIGGGAGFSISILDSDHITINDVSIDGTGSDVVFAYQAFAGLRYKINDRMGLSLEYHYFATESPTFKAEVAVGTDTDRMRFGGAATHALSIAFDFKF